jgi:hypothetical protein
MDRGQHNRIAFYNCSVLPNAAMAAPAYIAEHAIETAPVPIVHEHEGLDRQDRADAVEYLDTVVATRTMDRDDWVRTRVHAWFVDACHFNRLLQLVAASVHAAYDIRYRTFYEALLAADGDRFPVLAEVRAWLAEQARRIQAGEPEFVPSERWLNIWWPADQYVVVKLVAERRLPDFYAEAEALLVELLADHGIYDADGVLADAIALNKAMVRIPREFEDTEIATRNAILEFAQAEMAATPVPLDRRPALYRVDRSSTVWIDRQAWCEDVVVQYYRRTDFLYPVERIDAAAPAVGTAAPASRVPEAVAGEVGAD